jgi:hypothetical protein
MANHLSHKLAWNALNDCVQLTVNDSKDFALNTYDVVDTKKANYFSQTLFNTIQEFSQSFKFKQPYCALFLPDQSYLVTHLFQGQHCQMFTHPKMGALIGNCYGGQGCPGSVRYTTDGVLILYILLNLVLMNRSKYLPYFNQHDKICAVAHSFGDHDGKLPNCIVKMFDSIYTTYDYSYSRSRHLVEFNQDTTAEIQKILRLLFDYLVAYEHLCEVNGLTNFRITVDTIYDEIMSNLNH